MAQRDHDQPALDSSTWRGPTQRRVSQAFSGDTFQANLQQQYRDLRLLMPVEAQCSGPDNMCPVPDARLVLRQPTGWAGRELVAIRPEIGEPPSCTAGSPLVFPSAQYRARSRDYCQFQNAEEVAAWNRLFGPISAAG